VIEPFRDTRPSWGGKVEVHMVVIRVALRRRVKPSTTLSHTNTRPANEFSAIKSCD